MINTMVTLENYCLPQFSMKQKITSMLHLFAKHQSDHYDFIIGSEILSEIDIMIDMVPKGHWNKMKLKNLGKLQGRNSSYRDQASRI
jgi:hypothetical protein